MSEADPPVRLFLVGGPSAAGKTTIGLTLAEQIDGLEFVPRYTTRRYRGSELDGREYVFVSPACFLSKAAAGDFIEYRDYDFGMSYGLGKADVERVLAAGKNAIALMNLGKIEDVRRTAPDAVTLFLDVPLDVLRERLMSRGRNTAEEIAERLENAAAAAAEADRYDYVIDNSGPLSSTIATARSVILSEMSSPRR